MRKKILYITPNPIYGTNERSAGLVRVLSTKYIVYIIAIDSNERSTVRRFAKMLINLPRIYLSGIKYIYFRKADIIFCELIDFGFHGAILSIITGKPCIWDVHRNTLNLFRELKKPKIFKIIYPLVEKILWHFPSRVIVVSESEKKAYVRQGIDAGKIEVIPISVDFNLAKGKDFDKTKLRTKLKLSLHKKILLFFGLLDQQPNTDTARWINNKLAPAIYDKYGESVEIIIAGNGKICKEKHHPIVNFPGFRPNIFEYINASDIVIVPIWKGKGQQTKLIDSMMFGKLTIVNKVSAIGIPELSDGYNTIIAQDHDDFIKKTLTTLKTMDTLNNIQINAKKMIEIHYNWDIWKESLFEIVEEQTSLHSAG